MGPLFSVIYITDLPSELRCSAKLFADETSLFSVVGNVKETTANLNKDLEFINKWTHQWKMSFNPDPTKMAHKVLFSRKRSLIPFSFLMEMLVVVLDIINISVLCLVLN